MHRRPPFPPDGDALDDGERHDRGHRHGFGRLFGRGGPFSRARGSRMFDSGALRLVTLGIIAGEPRHGYEIIKGLSDWFQGAYSPSPGAIYPILRQLEDAGFVTAQAMGSRRQVSITEAGRAYLEEQRPELDRILAQIKEAAAPISGHDLRHAIHELRHAIFEKIRDGSLSAERAGKLQAAIRRARDEIERI